jgi:hypothetical protein
LESRSEPGLHLFFMAHNNSPAAPNSFIKAAFSTIEVLVAVLVCGVVFLGLYAGFTSGFGFIQLARENLRGTQIMEEKMETIRLYRWDQINQAGFIPTNFVDTFYPVGTQGTAGLSYTGKVTISSPALTEYYTDDLKQVTIDLNWLSGRVQRKRQMTTLVSRYGLQPYVY